MDKNKWFIAAIIVLLIFWWLIHPSPCNKSNNIEGFQAYQYGLPPRLHVVIDNDGNPINWHYQSPGQNGEYGCTQVSCGEKIADDMVCWRCCNYH